MTNSPTNLDNFKSRISRLFVEEREFVGDDGKSIKYNRLIIEFYINKQKVQVETKLDSKDMLLLSLADNVQGDLEV